MTKVTIIDGYVDEPTCLGVPPYISPYPRYITGAIYKSDDKNQINYFTIDQIRNKNNLINSVVSKSDLLIIISGLSVPGRYLSGYPASPNEIEKILGMVSKPLKILAGPAACYGFGQGGGKKTKTLVDVFDLVITGDSEIVIFDLLNSNLKIDKINPGKHRKNAHEIKEYATWGAKIVTQHPNHPNTLITEIETYRGCPRSITGGCSFCSEPLKGPPDFRPVEDIVEEIKNLYKFGVRHFRIGSQPCIFSYMSKDSGGEEFPKPNTAAVEKLFSNIRRVAPDLQTLHIDNANPGILARYPEESILVAETIIKYHTSGDVAAMGIESADPVVIKENNLKASPEESMKAIKLLNQVGSKRGDNGMPHLLPGLNFLFGLRGESKHTFELNYEFLKQILEQNQLLRRINLRQVIPIPNTKLYEIGTKNIMKHKNMFKRFKRKVNENIQRPMLKKLLPMGTVLKNLYTEKHDGKLTLGRQMGSYPLLVGIPGKISLNEWLDVKIIDYGYRSVTGLPYPLNINKADSETIMAIPGVGKKRASRLLMNRPFTNIDQIKSCMDDPEIAKQIVGYISL